METESFTTCEVRQEGAELSSWREALWGFEWAALRGSAVYAGAGVPGGSGQPVVLVPGFMGTDSQLFEMERWLRRIGYRPSLSGIGLNADCPDVLLEKLVETVEVRVAEAGQRVILVGHSLGGTLSRALAAMRPDLVAGIITLGSPVAEFRTSTWLHVVARWTAALVPDPRRMPRVHGDHTHSSGCSCQLVDALSRPFPDEVMRVAVYSRTDGVVQWQSCLDRDLQLNREVRGSHLGMIVNAEVYRTIAVALAAMVAAGGGHRAAA